MRLVVGFFNGEPWWVAMANKDGTRIMMLSAILGLCPVSQPRSFLLESRDDLKALACMSHGP